MKGKAILEHPEQGESIISQAYESSSFVIIASYQVKKKWD